MILNNKTILITGGTGSLGKQLVSRILSGEKGNPKKIIIFSRDEDKQHQMKIEGSSRKTHDVFFGNYKQMVDFRIGDVRDKNSLTLPIMESDIIINAAALKHVPVCEYFPLEAIKTNIIGSQNIVDIIKEHRLEKIVCTISTDKACKPVNTYGMTKALQERVILEANYSCPNSTFIGIRYGNVMASRGSIIPLFQKQIIDKQPITITQKDMTRFLMSLDKAVDTVFAALSYADKGDLFIPIVPAALITDLAEVLLDGKDYNKTFEVIGMRPGEKVHEILISEEEISRTYKKGDYYVIQSILPEIREYSDKKDTNWIVNEYSSKDNIVSKEQLKDILFKEGHLNF